MPVWRAVYFNVNMFLKEKNDGVESRNAVYTASVGMAAARAIIDYINHYFLMV